MDADRKARALAFLETQCSAGDTLQVGGRGTHLTVADVLRLLTARYEVCPCNGTRRIRCPGVHGKTSGREAEKGTIMTCPRCGVICYTNAEAWPTIPCPDCGQGECGPGMRRAT